jgi:hypothetical protein
MRFLRIQAPAEGEKYLQFATFVADNWNDRKPCASTVGSAARRAVRGYRPRVRYRCARQSLEGPRSSSSVSPKGQLRSPRAVTIDGCAPSTQCSAAIWRRTSGVGGLFERGELVKCSCFAHASSTLASSLASVGACVVCQHLIPYGFLGSRPRPRRPAQCSTLIDCGHARG